MAAESPLRYFAVDIVPSEICKLEDVLLEMSVEAGVNCVRGREME